MVELHLQICIQESANGRLGIFSHNLLYAFHFPFEVMNAGVQK